MAGLSMTVVAVLEAIAKSSKGSGTTLTGLFKTAARYPLKFIAMCIASPYLLLCIVLESKILRRKLVAALGLLVSISLALFSFSFLGSGMGALAVAGYFGVLWGIGAFLGTVMSMFLNVVIAAFVLIVFSTFALLMSASDVASYARSKIDDDQP